MPLDRIRLLPSPISCSEWGFSGWTPQWFLLKLHSAPHYWAGPVIRCWNIGVSQLPFSRELNFLLRREQQFQNLIDGYNWGSHILRKAGTESQGKYFCWLWTHCLLMTLVWSALLALGTLQWSHPMALVPVRKEREVTPCCVKAWRLCLIEHFSFWEKCHHTGAFSRQTCDRLTSHSGQGWAMGSCPQR